MRPMLKPALRRVWRDESTLQLGLTPAHAVMLSGLSAHERAVLALLDGSRDVPGIVEAATEAGVEPTVPPRLIDTLTTARVLDDNASVRPAYGEDDRQRLEPDLLSLSLRYPRPGGARSAMRRRQRASVAVHGTGRVGASIALLLAAAGLGELHCVDRAPLRCEDLAPGGIPEIATTARGSATAARADAMSTSLRVSADDRASATLAVLAPTSSGGLPELLAAARHRPHVLAQVCETTGIIGPLVVPGRTPCLRCVALARGERDPGWPSIAAQLTGAPAVTEPCDVTLATLVAALTAQQVLDYIDAEEDAATLAGILEYDLRVGTLRRRSVRAHPACGCGAATLEPTLA